MRADQRKPRSVSAASHVTEPAEVFQPVDVAHAPD
ncbi:hypothetical protein QFZ40_003051 [Arthrobacter pascens]|nr:hypothetical protein [Arthrobacter pascens]